MTVACSYWSYELGFPIILTKETPAVVRGLDYSEIEVETSIPG